MIAYGKLDRRRRCYHCGVRGTLVWFDYWYATSLATIGKLDEIDSEGCPICIQSAHPNMKMKRVEHCRPYTSCPVYFAEWDH